MYYLSDYDGIDERHKCKYEFTMDSGFMQRQIEGFLRNISGGGRDSCCTGSVLQLGEEGACETSKRVWL